MKLEINNDTNLLLRGMAILAIVMHNFCHFNGVPENEFTFSAANIDSFWSAMHGGISSALWAAISFLGHYGVQIFIFLSGYGLARKYAGGLPGFSGYCLHNLRKILALMLPAVVAYAIITIACGGDISGTLKDCISLVLFRAHITGTIAVGPFWYFGVALELYLFYYLIAHRGEGTTLLVICILCLFGEYFIAMVYGSDSSLLELMRMNIFNAIPAFCLGVYIARNPIEISNKTLHIGGGVMLGAALFLSIAPHPAAWLMSFVAWPLAAVWMAQLIAGGIVRSVLLKLGRASALLFATHPIVRHLARTLSDTTEHWGWVHLAVYILLSLLCVFIIARASEYMKAKSAKIA